MLEFKKENSRSGNFIAYVAKLKWMSGTCKSNIYYLINIDEGYIWLCSEDEQGNHMEIMWNKYKNCSKDFLISKCQAHYKEFYNSLPKPE